MGTMKNNLNLVKDVPMYVNLTIIVIIVSEGGKVGGGITYVPSLKSLGIKPFENYVRG
jgi:hypothetical protein